MRNITSIASLYIPVIGRKEAHICAYWLRPQLRSQEHCVDPGRLDDLFCFYSLSEIFSIPRWLIFAFGKWTKMIRVAQSLP
jgi:hypothetical protein